MYGMAKGFVEKVVVEMKKNILIRMTQMTFEAQLDMSLCLQN